MEIKVRAVEAGEEKSSQEIEAELLRKHEEKHGDPNETTIVDKLKEENNTPSNNTELKEEDVLSYIGNRYGKEVNSIDELMERRETSEELPDDVSAFFKYKKETGRSIEDFIKVNKDYNEVEPDKILADFYMATEEGLDADDVQDMISEFAYDEDLDEESDVKRRKLAKKRAITKAKNFFDEQKEKYKLPLESSTGDFSDSDNKDLESYRKYLAESKSVEEEANKRSDWFLDKTNEVFNNDFKGFDFSIGDNKINFSPGSAQDLKHSQSDITNFINKYLDKDGLITDATSYHRALSLAMNPDKFAKFFYEQGKTDAVKSDAKNSKNIDMEMRRSPEAVRKGGLSIRAVSQSSNSNGLRIKSNKRN